MRRSRTPATAWPAVADLMTILAVIGLSAAAVVATQSNERIDNLEAQVLERDSSIAVLEDSIVGLAQRIDTLNFRVIGFVPCWPGRPGEKSYFSTFDVTFANGRYTLSRNAEFALGNRFVDESPAKLLAVLLSFPTGPVNAARLVEFGQTVSSAITDHADYPADCRLAVTVNGDANGFDLAPIRRAGFFPRYR